MAGLINILVAHTSGPHPPQECRYWQRINTTQAFGCTDDLLGGTVVAGDCYLDRQPIFRICAPNP